MSDPPPVVECADDFEDAPDFPPVAPEFLALAVSEGCRIECEEDREEVLLEVASVTAEAERRGLTAAQRLAAANFFRTRHAEFYRDDGDMWAGVFNAIERVAATPWHRPVGTESHFARLDLATVDECLEHHDEKTEALVKALPYEPGRTRAVLDRMRQGLVEERSHLRSRMREHAWTEAVAARSMAARRDRRRPHTRLARRRGAGRPKASSSRSSARSGDGPQTHQNPRPQLGGRCCTRRRSRDGRLLDGRREGRRAWCFPGHHLSPR